MWLTQIGSPLRLRCSSQMRATPSAPPDANPPECVALKHNTADGPTRETDCEVETKECAWLAWQRVRLDVRIGVTSCCQRPRNGRAYPVFTVKVTVGAGPEFDQKAEFYRIVHQRAPTRGSMTSESGSLYVGVSLWIMN